MSYYESITLVVYFFFSQRQIIADLIFFLKLNFDYLIYSFFEGYSQELRGAKENELRMFNTSAQVFEFRKLMTSYNEMASPYMDD